MKFIELKNLKNRIYNNTVSARMLYEHFQKYEDETLFVISGEKSAIGIVTPGDLYRYLNGEEDEYINYKYSFLEEANFGEAQHLFDRIKVINEIPVIKHNRLLGIITNEKKKEKSEWERIRLSHDMHIHLRDSLKYYEKKLIPLFKWYKANGIKLYYAQMPTLKELGLKRADFGSKDFLPDGVNAYAIMDKTSLQNYFKDDYYDGIESDIIRDCNRLQMNYDNGIQRICDIESDNYNIHNGHRKTSNNPKNATKKIYLVGPCYTFGVFVKDDRTIGYYLQDILNSRGLDDYEVVTMATNLGGIDLSPLFCEKMGGGDQIIFFGTYPALKKAFDQASLKTEYDVIDLNTSDAYIKGDDWLDNYTNCHHHHNHIINQNIAVSIFPQLKLDDVEMENRGRLRYQDYFISYSVVNYFEEYIDALNDSMKKADTISGAIVMNCNPFTKGHRYLIETAAEQVDVLYIFVVEEDRSHFSFDKRFEMVKQGIREIDGDIRVYPSGKYIISNKTFSQYFDKEKTITAVDDMSYDIRIFGEVVCKLLGISKRFAGEEPTDVVTNAYNRTMERILPEYGVEFIEIPRKTLDNGKIISATKVRELLASKDFDTLSNYLPQSTVDILLSDT